MDASLALSIVRVRHFFFDIDSQGRQQQDACFDPGHATCFVSIVLWKATEVFIGKPVECANRWRAVNADGTAS